MFLNVRQNKNIQFIKTKLMKKLNHKIEYGDRIFARLTMGQRTIFEFVADRVADLSELLAQLRFLTRGIRGLATLHLRNQTKGWCAQRPLMLYAHTTSSTPIRTVTSPFRTTAAEGAFNHAALAHLSL